MQHNQIGIHGIPFTPRETAIAFAQLRYGNNISKSRKQFSKEKWVKIRKKQQDTLINGNGGVHPMIGKKIPRHTKEEYKKEGA